MGRREEYKALALERIERLFELAERVPSSRLELAHRYVELAWRLATRYNVRFPPHLKRKFCRKCKAFLRPGITSRVRTRSKPSRLVMTCLRCGHRVRLPLKTAKLKMNRAKGEG